MKLADVITFVWRCGALAAVALTTNGVIRAEDTPAENFLRHIKPILSDKCFHCHGPDSQTRQADLRLDSREAMIESGVVEPGDASASMLFERVSATDEELRMPPPDSNRSLSQQEIELLRRWIDSGAEYPPHWSFIPPKKLKTEVAEEFSAGQSQNPIDSIVAKQLAERNLHPAEEASREALLRRVSFDLTGLPPTVGELDEFLSDESPDAYQKAVDRLLASPHFGERMAQDWLDLARYSDSFGYSADREKSHWRWRDWVIKAFNENMPYDKFVTWQLAGDLLPNATKEQMLATGFCRNHPQSAEGGIIEEEFRVEYVADRTQTFGTAFLGLTVGCARCHDHKFDPISQKEFYELFSFFNNIDEAGQITWLIGDLPAPTILLPTPDEQRQVDRLQAVVSEVETDIAQYRDDARSEYERWKGTEVCREALANAEPTDMTSHFTLDTVSRESIPNSVANGPVGMIFDPENQTMSPQSLDAVDGVHGKGVRLNGDDALWFEGVGKFSRARPFTIGMWVWIPKDLQVGAIFHNMDSGVLYRYRGYHLCVEDGKFDVRIARDYPYNAIQLVSKSEVPRDEWIHVALAYDGSSSGKGVKLYVGGKRTDCEIVRDNLYKEIYFPRNATPHTASRLQVGARRRDKGLSNGRADDLVVFERELSAVEVAALVDRPQSTEKSWDQAEKAASEFEDADLFEFYLSRRSEYRSLLLRLAESRENVALAIEPIAESMVMVEMPKPRQAYLLDRGAYNLPKEPVSPGTPRAVLPYPANLPPNRLGLAQWLFLPENPLPARVAVNRYWQLFFGRGLVPTTENFGSQGEAPTYPELLDFLATEFRDSGWDVKRLAKLIVTSATYRQDSKGTPEQLASDPENNLLARGPSGRLTAEQIRDQALLASGLLVDDVGGPSVKPYQPEGLWSINVESPDYVQDHGDKLYRRSLYTVWKQTNPPPMMSLFDAPTRSYCVVRREQTATPLQALAMFNDPQVLEAARAMAQKVVREYPDNLSLRWRRMYRAATSTEPSAAELAVLNKLYEEQLNHFSGDPTRADELLKVGEHSIDTELWNCDIAATTMAASAILGLEQCSRKP